MRLHITTLLGQHALSQPGSALIRGRLWKLVIFLVGAWLKEGSSPCRDGSDGCSFVGIDVSADFLQQAKANLLEACPGLLADKVELVQAPYLEGLKEARAM